LYTWQHTAVAPAALDAVDVVTSSGVYIRSTSQRS